MVIGLSTVPVLLAVPDAALSLVSAAVDEAAARRSPTLENRAEAERRGFGVVAGDVGPWITAQNVEVTGGYDL